ncbi:MAG TPA: Rrf2 family transcriptional regulator [Bryobacteraceae bacterium]|nr:Rrf2 family transcriptional regulator [Bryobacteraceae bacterium]
MLSQTAEYALRAMVSLATANGQPRTAHEIAAEAHVPLDYLSKVLNSLSRAGLVTGQRGRGGGFHVAPHPAELTVLEVVSAVDPLKRIKTCPLGLQAHGTNLCPLHRKLDDAVRTVEEAFASTTIQSLVGKSFCESEECHAV